MSDEHTNGWPSVVPMPTYKDVGEASRWLCQAFGFEEGSGSRTVRGS
jgi:hypothetical protein